MAEISVPSFRGYDDPLALVDRTEIPYEIRLKTLQEWQEELARTGASAEQTKQLLGAIHALEIGAEVQDDDPAEQPDTTGYGGGHK